MNPEIPDLDLSLPNPARVYDYWLGGAGNFAVDRELGDEMIAIEPQIPRICQENRAFLRRVVTWLCEHGVEQFLDLGSGIPTVGNVHEIAQDINRDARVVYVDNEPVAAAHSRRLLEHNPRTGIVQADLRDVPAMLNAPSSELLDRRRPVAVLALSVLQYFPGTIPREVLAGYREAFTGDCYLALSHITDEPSVSPRMNMPGVASATRRASHRAHLRGREEITGLFGDDMELISPGIVPASEWHPEEGHGNDPCGLYVGLGVRAR